MPPPLRPIAPASRAGLSNQIDMMPRISTAATTRLTPCLAQNWKRVPLRLPTNRPSTQRSAVAISQAARMKPSDNSSLCRFSSVAPISVTPNTLAPCTGAAAAGAAEFCAACALLTRSLRPCCTRAQPERSCEVPLQQLEGERDLVAGGDSRLAPDLGFYRQDVAARLLREHRRAPGDPGDRHLHSRRLEPPRRAKDMGADLVGLLGGNGDEMPAAPLAGP